VTLSSPDISPGSHILILPLGSHEQHGPHLPLDTDRRIIDAVVTAALSRTTGSRFIVAPTIPVTASDEHSSFPGTLSLGTETMTAALHSIVRSAWWSGGVCIVNGHGGNVDALNAAIRTMPDGIPPCDVWSPPMIRPGDLHAGHVETSLMLHIDPSSVRTASIEPGTFDGDPASLIALMRSGGIAAVAENGVVGDPRQASAVDGAAYLDAYAGSLAAHLDRCLARWPTGRE